MRILHYAGFFLGLLGALGNHLEPLESFAHFQPWILLLACLLSILAVFSRLWITSGLLLLVVIYHGILMAPYLSFSDLRSEPIDASTASVPTDRIRVLQFNINADNGRSDDLASAVEQLDADIIVICEANVHLLDRLEHLHEKYAYRVEAARWPNTTIHGVSGTVIWSTFPLRASEIIELEKGDVLICKAIANIEQTEVSLYGVHLLAPRTDEQIIQRNEGLEEIAQLIAVDPNKNILLIGDLNQSLWTPNARKFLKATQLKSILKGHMFLSTWPSSTYPFGIAIDHMLYKGNLECLAVASLEGTGSDHRKLVAEFQILRP